MLEIGPFDACWNGQHGRTCIDVPGFNAAKVATMMKEGDSMLTIDMKSGYHQVPLKPARACVARRSSGGFDRALQRPAAGAEGGRSCRCGGGVPGGAARDA